MNLFVARQPIFDTGKSTVGYELLYRESTVRNEYSALSGELASSRVMIGTFLSSGLESLTGDKIAYVNFTTDLVKNRVASLFPKDRLVVEILENVPPTREVLRACEWMKAEGYTLALDDYVVNPIFRPLTELADIIKVDFRNTTIDEQYEMLSSQMIAGKQFLAEKVETQEEFDLAKELGYSLYQGYFFAKPVVLSASPVPAGKLGLVRLLQAINMLQPDFNQIINAIESDVALALETIKLSNSAFYVRRQKITSIRQAVVTLGLEGVRKYIYLASLSRIADDSQDVLVSMSMLRSKSMEIVAASTGQANKSPEYSMLGLFSLLDALTACSFQQLFANLNISEEIMNILAGAEQNSKMAAVYRAMLCFERGDWQETSRIADAAGLSVDTIAEAYLESLKWYSELTGIAA